MFLQIKILVGGWRGRRGMDKLVEVKEGKGKLVEGIEGKRDLVEGGFSVSNLAPV